MAATTAATSTTSAKPASTPTTNEYVFHMDDMDFSHYDNPQLAYLCDHRVFVRSRFPKLVFALVHHPRFVEWIASTPDVACASRPTRSRASWTRCARDRRQGHHTRPSARRRDVLRVLVEQCWQHKPLRRQSAGDADGRRACDAVAEHERRVLHRVQHAQAVPVLEDGRGRGAHRTGGGDGGKRASQSSTTRKKSRSIWID